MPKIKDLIGQDMRKKGDKVREFCEKNGIEVKDIKLSKESQ